MDHEYDNWQASRKDSPHLNKVVHPYDWTYTTDYKGDLKEHLVEKFILLNRNSIKCIVLTIIHLL